MNFVSYQEFINDIHEFSNTLNLLDHTGVIGIPRSGMIPASILATRFNLPFADVHYFLSTGGRFYPSVRGTVKRYGNEITRPEPHRLLIVDDTCDSEATFRQVINDLDNHLGLRNIHYSFVAIYSTYESPLIRSHKRIPQPRIFEWNWTRCGDLNEIMVDLDGLLCHDPEEKHKETDEIYSQWALNATPRFIPVMPIRAIVSARLEQFRKPTEEWLRLYGIEYQELVLLDATKEQRTRMNLYAKHKIANYRNSGSRLFIESEPWQAKEIYEQTKKPVLCLPTHGHPIFYGKPIR